VPRESVAAGREGEDPVLRVVRPRLGMQGVAIRNQRLPVTERIQRPRLAMAAARETRELVEVIVTIALVEIGVDGLGARRL